MRVPNRRPRRHPTRPGKGYFRALDALHTVDSDERRRQQLEHAVRVGDTDTARRLTRQLAEQGAES